jgi:hypothetical protein
MPASLAGASIGGYDLVLDDLQVLDGLQSRLIGAYFLVSTENR